MENLPLRKQNPGERIMLGRFQINPLVYLYVPILFCTPLYTYHMAVSHHEEDPFPGATVTGTACHYPQDIVFRYTMLIASSIISLTFYIIFRWLQNQCTRVGFRRLNRWYLYVTELSMLCYSITIGTIDEKGIGSLHGPCAVIFFVVWIVVIIRITTFISEVRKWDTTIVSGKSLLLKKLLGFYVLGVWIYCIIGLIFYPPDHELEDLGNKFIVIIQWNSVLINLLWVLSFVFEWRELNFCLNFYPQNQQQQRQQTQQKYLQKPTKYTYTQQIPNSQSQYYEVHHRN